MIEAKNITATYFSPTLNGKTLSASLSFDRLGVSIKTEDGNSHRWGYHQTNAEIGGAHQHLLFISQLQTPAEGVYFEIPRDLIRNILEITPPQWSAPLRRKTRAKAIALYATVSFGVILVAALIAGFYFRNYIANNAVSLVPYSIEQSIGEKLYASASLDGEDVKDPQLIAAVENVMRPLLSVIPKQFSPIVVHIRESKELNAYALPGGHIVFNTQSLMEFESSAELLGVAAHELAHVTQRHVVRNLVQGAGVFLTLQLILGDISGLIAVVVDQGNFLLSQKFSREMEEEADRVGFDYLIQAKVDPRGLTTFFARIQKLKNDALGEYANVAKNLEIMSSHPDTQARIDTINAMINKLPSDLKASLKYDSKEFDKLKKIIKKRK